MATVSIDCEDGSELVAVSLLEDARAVLDYGQLWPETLVPFPGTKEQLRVYLKMKKRKREEAVARDTAFKLGDRDLPKALGWFTNQRVWSEDSLFCNGVRERCPVVYKLGPVDLYLDGYRPGWHRELKYLSQEKLAEPEPEPKSVPPGCLTIRISKLLVDYGTVYVSYRQAGNYLVVGVFRRGEGDEGEMEIMTRGYTADETKQWWLDTDSKSVIFRNSDGFIVHDYGQLLAE